ncbi:acyl carrier protein [Streptomyces polygonati]|uniref:Acyl carrier protein n=1 Tax=Streptomyces polygonati TaxID=1617087 RepID=A0ABV8HMF7_9ACTN
MTDAFTEVATDHDTPTTSGDGSPQPDLRGRVEQGITLLLPRVLNQQTADPLPVDAALMEDLGLTSGKTLELILELEDHLDIQIDVEDITPDDLRSAATLATFVATHVVDED